MACIAPKGNGEYAWNTWYATAEALIALNQWETVTAQRQGLMDLSQKGGSAIFVISGSLAHML